MIRQETYLLFTFLFLMFVPGIVATADNGGTCQEPASDLGHRRSVGLTGT